ncbi:MAG: FtsH-binding integral membrane protein [Vicingaceae bacterium]|jgi:FtsH-binding integral membrane protein
MIDYSNNNFNVKTSGVKSQDAVSTFLANVFTYMGGALAITGLLAYWFGNTPSLMTYLINPTGGATLLGYVVMFSPLAFVLVMSFAFNKLSSFALLGLFILYAAVMGLSMSFIFLAYTASSIASTFFITAATFGVMAVLGYTTKQDLTKFGSILFMALIGIIIASIVNMFLGNGMLDIIISCVGVLVFTGLTAYDVQKLKRIGAGVEYGSESSNKLAIMGALNLYLDFVNLFMMLLRLFGDRR